MCGEKESLRRSKYELETSLKNLAAEKDHIVNINEGLSIRHTDIPDTENILT
jgi:hypothetical protein